MAAATWKSETKECDLESYRRRYSFPESVIMRLPEQNEGPLVPPGVDEVCVNDEMFKAGLRLPFPAPIRAILTWANLAPQQLTPNSWRIMLASSIVWAMKFKGETLTPQEFFFFYKPIPDQMQNTWSFQARSGRSIINVPAKYQSSNKRWTQSYFFISGSGWEFFPWDEETVIPGRNIPYTVNRQWGLPSDQCLSAPTLNTEEGARAEELLAWIKASRGGPNSSDKLITPENQEKYFFYEGLVEASAGRATDREGSSKGGASAVNLPEDRLRKAKVDDPSDSFAARNSGCRASASSLTMLAADNHSEESEGEPLSFRRRASKSNYNSFNAAPVDKEKAPVDSPAGKHASDCSPELHPDGDSLDDQGKGKSPEASIEKRKHSDPVEEEQQQHPDAKKMKVSKSLHFRCPKSLNFRSLFGDALACRPQPRPRLSAFLAREQDATMTNTRVPSVEAYQCSSEVPAETAVNEMPKNLKRPPMSPSGSGANETSRSRLPMVSLGDLGNLTEVLENIVPNSKGFTEGLGCVSAERFVEILIDHQVENIAQTVSLFYDHLKFSKDSSPEVDTLSLKKIIEEQEKKLLAAAQRQSISEETAAEADRLRSALDEANNKAYSLEIKAINFAAMHEEVLNELCRVKDASRNTRLKLAALETKAADLAAAYAEAQNELSRLKSTLQSLIV